MATSAECNIVWELKIIVRNFPHHRFAILLAQSESPLDVSCSFFFQISFNALVAEFIVNGWKTFAIIAAPKRCVNRNFPLSANN
jgi:hypothetical protein